MAFVLDASVTVSWFFPDEDHPDAREAWRRSDVEQVLVPGHWWFEVRNTMLMGERRQRLSEKLTISALEQLRKLPIDEAPKPEEADVFSLARKHRLTFYDAAYLELARRYAVSLATLDGDMAKAARAEGVRLVGVP